MFKLNHVQYPNINPHTFNENCSLEALKVNDAFEQCMLQYKTFFPYSFVNTFSFSEDGFFAMMMKLNGKIAVSMGESQAIVSGAKLCEKFGLNITFIELNNDGSVNLDILSKTQFDYIFISSYVMDTFVTTNLQEVRKRNDAKIIANISASCDDIDLIDMALLDAYKLTGYQTHSVVLHNEELEEQFLSQYDFMALKMIYDAITKPKKDILIKEEFIKILQEELAEDMFFFVDNATTLSHTVHFGLKDIKAREIIRSLALGGIFITNGEGCSLGLSKPSRIIQAMGYTQTQSRQSISLSFDDNLSTDDMKKIAKQIAKKYRQIIRLK